MPFTLLSTVSVYSSQIIIGMSQEPDSLDPLFAQMNASFQVLGTIFYGGQGNTPAERDNKWKVMPRLSYELPSLENKLWKILPNGKMQTVWHIRKDAVWSDGQPITADDAIFAHTVIMDNKIPVVSRDVDRRIKKIEARDNGKTLVITWKENFAYADSEVVHPFLPKHLLESVYKKSPEKYDKSFYSTAPIGDGPYKIAVWKSGSHIILERNSNFFGRRPAIDKIIFKFIPDSNTLMANVLSGEVDAVVPVGFLFDQGLELAKKAKDFDVQITEGLVWEHIDFNLDNKYLSDKRLRQAMLYAIDREELVKTLFSNRQKVAHSWLPPRHYAYWNGVKKYPCNPQKAKQLLKEAGWSKGADGILRNNKDEKLHLILMTTSGNKTREQVEEILQAQWREVGIEIEIKNEPAKVFFGETVKKRKFKHLAMYAWSMSPIGDGESLWTTHNIPSAKNSWMGQNNTGWRNKKSDRIDRLVPQTLDKEKRIELLKKEQKIWTEELPALPLYFRADITVSKKSLKNWLPTGNDTPVTWNAEEWYYAQ